MKSMTDERLAGLLAEHDRLGARVLEIDARLAADERALEDLARPARGRAGSPSTLAEISARDGLLATGAGLSADGVRQAWAGREAALERRRQVIIEIGDGLPEGEWVASGEWALMVLREHRGGPRILRRALLLAVERSKDGAGGAEALSLSADAEASRLHTARISRFLFSHPKIGKAFVGACVAAGLIFCFAGMGASAELETGPLSSLELLVALATLVGMVGSLAMIFWGYGVVRGETSTGEQIPVPPTNPGEVRSDRLTASYRLPGKAVERECRDEACGTSPRAVLRANLDRAARRIGKLRKKRGKDGA